MTPKNPSPQTDFNADDAPDLSAAEWRDKLSKSLLASAPLEGIDLERTRDFGRDVHLTDDGVPLRTEEEYRAALREIEEYFREEPDPGTQKAARFDQLAEQIKLYEGAHWPISPPNPEK